MTLFSALTGWTGGLSSGIDAGARGVRLARFDGLAQDELGVFRGGRPVHRLVHRPVGQRSVGPAGGVATTLATAPAGQRQPVGCQKSGPGSLTSGDRWSDMIPTCRFGCCT
jgi:hypothetical protein